MLINALVISCIALLCAVQSWATPIDQLEKDFSPVSGYVVMAAGSEFIIDLDSSQGVTVGDLFSVVEKGGDIVHPVTKKVIGSLDQVSAVLKVTRIKSGYSYAVKVRGDVDPAAGTAISRFDSIDAVFQDHTGKSEALEAKVKAALPSFQWQGGGESAQADLVFEAGVTALQVRDQSGQLLRSYPVVADKVVAPPTAHVVPTGTVPQAALNLPAPAPVAMPQQGAVTYQSHTQVGNFQGGALSMEFPRFVKIGQFATKTQMADFENYNNELLLATTDGSSIDVFKVTDSLQPVGKGDSETAGSILALSWWQPSSGGLYLVAVVWGDDQVETDVLQWDGQSLQAVVVGRSQILAGFDADGDGTSELMLGQDFSRENFYGSRFSAYQLQAGQLENIEVPIELPSQFRVVGGLLTDLSGDGRPESVFVRNRRLYVYSGKDQIYKSNKEMGASVSGVTYDVDPDAQNPMITTASCEVAPVAADLDGDGRPEVVAISAEGSFLQAAGVASSINQSWLSVLKYQNGMMLKGTLGDKLERPLQGLAVVNGQALMVATDLGGLMDGNEATYVLGVPVK
jgi:hypothetical protein